VTAIPNDQSLGVLLLIGAVVGAVLYFWLVFYMNPLLILQLTSFVVIAGVLAIVAWIGYTMATTPPPEPLEFEDTS
jgi:predicted DNA-binding transcriptional regulator